MKLWLSGTDNSFCYSLSNYMIIWQFVIPLKAVKKSYDDMLRKLDSQSFNSTVEEIFAVTLRSFRYTKVKESLYKSQILSFLFSWSLLFEIIRTGLVGYWRILLFRDIYSGHPPP